MDEKPPAGILPPFPPVDTDPPLPPPRPECIPVPGQRNTWMCDGPPEADPLDPDEQEMVDWIQAQHPDWKVPMDGASIDTDEIPREYQREWIKFRNPNAIFEIDGIPIEKLGEILDRHNAELARIPGFNGSGIDKDGIFIQVEKEHGEFPTELEGAKVHFLPAMRAVLLGR